MPDLSLALTYTPPCRDNHDGRLSGLIDQLESSYQAAAVAPRIGHDGSLELWQRAERPSRVESIAADANRLISEIEYLERALRRESTGASGAAYDRALRGLFDELDRLRRPEGRSRALPALNLIRMRMESPLILVLGIPDAFVLVGGLSGVGALLALIERKANVFGRIKLERDQLKLAQTKVVFEQDQIEEERRLWREGLDAAEPENEPVVAAKDRQSQLELPFALAGSFQG
jgi:hypothetical protein